MSIIDMFVSAFIHNSCHVIKMESYLAVMAEWLRRWTRNPMGYSRAGSNPVHSDEPCFAFTRVEAICKQGSNSLSSASDIVESNENSVAKYFCRVQFYLHNNLPRSMVFFAQLLICDL